MRAPHPSHSAKSGIRVAFGIRPRQSLHRKLRGEMHPRAFVLVLPRLTRNRSTKGRTQHTQMTLHKHRFEASSQVLVRGVEFFLNEVCLGNSFLFVVLVQLLHLVLFSRHGDSKAKQADILQPILQPLMPRRLTLAHNPLTVGGRERPGEREGRVGWKGRGCGSSVPSPPF
jgi:hypothetical protein